MRAVDAVDHSGFSFFAFPPWNPTISDPTSTINFLPMSQLRWWLLQLITTGLIETKALLLMHEMHVSSVWMPLVTASGCSLLLRSLWKQSVSLNKNPALSNVQWSQGLILRCKRLLWQSCHYKRDIKHHRTPSAHWRPGATLNTVPAIENCAGKKWQMEMVLCVWLTTAVLWFPASALMWSGQCGFRGQTGATAVWFGIFFPLEANRMSLMNHSVFQLSHLTILQSSPHH